jgi:hypothetical protein
MHIVVPVAQMRHGAVPDPSDFFPCQRACSRDPTDDTSPWSVLRLPPRSPAPGRSPVAEHDVLARGFKAMLHRFGSCGSRPGNRGLPGRVSAPPRACVISS